MSRSAASPFLFGKVAELADCTGFESRRSVKIRGFESHPCRRSRVVQLAERRILIPEVGSSSLPTVVLAYGVMEAHKTLTLAVAVRIRLGPLIRT